MAAQNHGHDHGQFPADAVPAAFRRAVEDVSRVVPRPEVSISPMPPPQRIAPFAHALSGDVTHDGEQVGTGRFIVLHDPAGNDAWNGSFRCVTFAKAEIEPEMAEDPVMTDVGWSWLLDALAGHDAGHDAASGSVTVVRSDSFGQLAADGGSAQLEVRASWTPTGGLGPHAEAWLELLAEVSGLPPVQPGVVPLATRKPRRPR